MWSSSTILSEPAGPAFRVSDSSGNLRGQRLVARSRMLHDRRGRRVVVCSGVRVFVCGCLCWLACFVPAGSRVRVALLLRCYPRIMQLLLERMFDSLVFGLW